jgi:hypothetical protein
MIITRLVDSQIIIRLYNSNLKSLQESTTDVVKDILKTPGLSIIYNKIEICEKGGDNVLLSGNVIPSGWETFNKDKKSSVSVFVFLIAVILIEVTLYRDTTYLFLSPFMKESLQKVTPAFITTALVSFFNLVLAYLNIRKKVVLWSVEGEDLN